MKKNKLARIHKEPEYQLKDTLKGIILPAEQTLPKKPIKEKILDNFNMSLRIFKEDINYFLPKKAPVFLKPDLEKHEEQEIQKEREQLNLLLKRTITQTNTYEKPSLVERFKDEFNKAVGNYKNNITPWKLIKENIENRKILKEHDFYKSTTLEKIKNEFNYFIKPKLQPREDETHKKAISENNKSLHIKLASGVPEDDRTIEDAGYIPPKATIVRYDPVKKGIRVTATSFAMLLATMYFFPNNTSDEVTKYQTPKTVISSKEKIKPVFQQFQTTEQENIIYTGKQGDNLSKIVKKHFNLTGTALYSKIIQIQELNKNLINHPDKKQQEALSVDKNNDGLSDLVLVGGKIVLDVKEKEIQTNYETRFANGEKTYFDMSGTKLDEKLQNKIKTYEAKEIEKATLLSNSYASINNLVEKQILNHNNYVAQESNSEKPTILTNKYLEQSEQGAAIIDTIKENYLYNTKKELDAILANKYDGLDSTKFNVLNVISKEYGKSFRKRSNIQKKYSKQMRESEILYKNTGQGMASEVKYKN